MINYYIKKIAKIYFSLFIFLMFCSCEQDRYPMYNHSAGKEITNQDNYGELFDVFWTTMSDNYPVWDIDPTNWDKIYREYQPKFKALATGYKNNTGAIDEENQKKAAAMFKEITKDLIDGHFFISGLGNTLNFSPSQERWQHSKEYYPSLEEGYFFPDKNCKKGIGRYLDCSSVTLSSPFSRSKALTGEISRDEKKIIYFTFRQFGLERDGFSVEKTLNTFFERIYDSSDKYKGLILDLRGNGGGAVSDAQFFVSRFFNKRQTIGYTRNKVGPNRLSYAPWAPYDISPYDNKAPSFPIVVLVDKYSVSMSEITAMALSTLPNVTIVGDTTWGGTGALHNLTFSRNGGKYFIGNEILGVYFYCPLMKYRGPDGKSYEGKGFTPNIVVKRDESTAKYDDYGDISDMEKDNQLEKAVEVVLKGR